MLIGPKAYIDDPPSVMSSLSDSLDDTGEVVALMEFFLEALGFLLNLGFYMLLLALNNLV